MGSVAVKGLVIRLSVAGASLYPMLACALGLSEIQLDSRLNQPLRARIEVLDVSDEEWSRVHTRLNWQSSPDAMPIHPDQLEAITLRAVEDANHRHFIEVRSTAAMIEPLFDLPIEVAGPAAHIIRNYSVLLDPPTPGDDAPGQAGTAHISGAAPVGGAQTGGASQISNSAQLTAAPPTGNVPQTRSSPSRADIQQTPTGRHATSNTRHRHGRHRHSGSRVSSPAGTAAKQATESHAPQTQVPASQAQQNPASEKQAPRSAALQNQPLPSHAAERKELEQQLETLQQTLAGMQATIAAQNAQIAALTAKIAARSQSQAAHSPAVVATAAARAPQSEATSADDSSVAESDDTASDHKSNRYLWGAGLGLIAGLAAALTALFMRKRAARNADTTPELTATVRAVIEEQASRFDTARPAMAPVQQQPVAHQETGSDTAIMWSRAKAQSDITVESQTEDEPPVIVKAQSDTGKFPSATLDDMTQTYFATLPTTSIDDTAEVEADVDSTQVAEVDAAALLELDAEMCHAAEMAAQGMDTGSFETALLPSAETAVLPSAETAILSSAQTAVLYKRETTHLSEAETAILDKLERSLEDDEQDEETSRFIKKVAI